MPLIIISKGYPHVFTKGLENNEGVWELVKMGPDRIDALCEVGNIGVGHAVTSLAILLDKRIDIEVPRAQVISIKELVQRFGDPEELVCCVCFNLEGDFDGQIVFVFDFNSTLRLVEVLFSMAPGTLTSIDDMGESAVREIGNVLTGSFITAVAEFTGLKISQGLPMYAFDMLGAVLTSVFISYGKALDNVLTIDTEFKHETETIKGQFVLFTEQSGINRLFESLGV